MKRRRSRLDELAAAGMPSTNGTPQQRNPPVDVGDADGPATLFKDAEELSRLAFLMKNNPAAYAVEKVRLKQQGVSLTDLTRALKRIASAIPDPAPARPARQLYTMAHGRIWKNSPAGDGQVALCNFTARIVADVTADDGAERRRLIRVAGTLDTGEALDEVEVTAEQFATMRWPLNAWGHRAAVFPGQCEHLMTALQMLSIDVKRETVYTHTGWREVGGRWCYLHAGGAVGADGPVAGVRVSLPSPLTSYKLPDPPTGERLRVAVRASLSLLHGLAPDQVAFPLLIAPYRAAAGGVDYAIGLVGRTGAAKTAIAALAQQHFGAEMVATNLPANWSSTANATEALAFSAKDALLTIDDYCPAGQYGAAKLQGTADRLIRSAGNNSGRSRMTAGTELRAGKPPRGLILVTGEDLPGGSSLRARLWTVEVAREAVNFARLSECQEDAAAGLYAEALAGFVKWLAADYPAHRDRIRAERDRRRGELATLGGHKRVPTTAADLLAALDLFLSYAAAVGAVNPDEAKQWRERGWPALLETAAEQAQHQRDADPAERFLALLISVLSSGRAHLADLDGRCPSNDKAAGWRREGSEPRPQGKRIGWVFGDKLWLEPEAGLAEVVKLADEQGQPLVVTPRTLWKQLHESGHLAETDRSGGKVRYKVRVTAEGVRREVIVLPAERFCTTAFTGGGGGYVGISASSAPIDGFP